MSGDSSQRAMEADEIMRAMRLSCFQLNNSLQRTFYDVSSQISGAVMASAGHKSTRVGKVLGGRIGVVVSVVLLQSAHMVSAYIKLRAWRQWPPGGRGAPFVRLGRSVV